MNRQEIIDHTKEMVKEKLTGEGSGHDWFHIERVWKTALQLAEKEGANKDIVQLAALVHDLADDKVVASEEEGLNQIRSFLTREGLDAGEIKQIIDIVQSLSFSKGKKMRTLEGEIVQDADRLDAIGAIGIARAFTYAGSKGRPIFDPSYQIRENMTKEEYRKGDSSTVHHFYEKLLKLKDLMNTESAKQLAQQRHEFMEQYLTQLFDELGVEEIN
jgi:uncharacterized protein